MYIFQLFSVAVYQASAIIKDFSVNNYKVFVARQFADSQMRVLTY